MLIVSNYFMIISLYVSLYHVCLTLYRDHILFLLCVVTCPYSKQVHLGFC